ncbi:low-density lipoprotein receptor-related protein 1B-like isoform X2 [Mytilus californianus]|uniref:low-density lipoprotein receptor-related protein 1B-like isoform X2 n=1 Tax=Mytilus californianus TaxID=6549 RepID=UPI002245843E|nr:low-density lipoprotein receptor-related protein 1B-like isoform X2 [Mytilus californianus]
MEVKVWFCMCIFLNWILLASSYSRKLLYSVHNVIMEFDFDTRNVTVLVEHGDDHVFAMDYDYKNRFLYFPRYNTRDIVRFAYPSKTIILQTVVKTDQYQSGIAVDSTNGHIYWTTYDVIGRLSRCNLDGSNVTVLSTLSLPFVIRLDLTNRWMYIVEHDIGIFKSTFDLSEKRTIVNFTSTPVYCMDIRRRSSDTEENRLYWINNDGDMKSCEDDGSDVKTILSTNISRSYLAISVVGSNIYYANDNQLLMVTKTPGSTPTILYNDTNRIDSIFVFDSSGM